MTLDWSLYWYYDADGNMICKRCGSEVWFLEKGYICTGEKKASREPCFNEDERS